MHSAIEGDLRMYTAGVQHHGPEILIVHVLLYGTG